MNANDGQRMTTAAGHPIPEGSAIVTPAQMFQEIRDTKSAVDRLTDTINPALQEVRRDLADMQTKHAELSVMQAKDGNRLTVIETKLVAAWAVIGLVIVALGVVAAYLGH